MSVPKPPRADATEAEWQSFVTDALTLGGWSWWHETDSRKSRSGFPDLVAWHAHRGVIFAELKTDRGRLRPDQAVVLADLRTAIGGGTDAMLGPRVGRRLYVRLWRPADWRDVLSVTGVAAMVEVPA